jgi:integrase
MIVVERWIASGAPGRNRIRAGRRAVERYDQLMRCHVLPALGSRSLQQLQAIEIDALYAGLTSKLKARTAHHVHTVFNACLVTAERKGLVAANPMARVKKLPSPGESDHGVALDADELRRLLEGFLGSTLYGIVSVTAFTRARRNEILALRWTDFDAAEKTLRIERAFEASLPRLA